MGVRSSKGGSEELAALLRDRREAADMSRRELADSTGLSYPYISQLETAYRLPSPRAMQALARALRVPVNDLFAALPQEQIPTAPEVRRGRRAQHADTRWIANPAHPAPATPASRREAVKSAVESLEALPPTDRLTALNDVQAAILRGVVRDQTAQ